jgi:hypothetical protein
MTAFITPDEKHKIFRSQLVINFLLLAAVSFFLKLTVEQAMCSCLFTLLINQLVIFYYRRQISKNNVDDALLNLHLAKLILSSYAWISLTILLAVEDKFHVSDVIKTFIERSHK